jgi:repressor LexA
VKTVGQILRERREALGLTLAAVADQIGATKSYLSMIENHKVPNPPSRAVIQALEKALKITDGELSRAADWENTPAAIREQFEAMAGAANDARDLAQRIKDAAGKRPDGTKNLDKIFRSGELIKLVKSVRRGKTRPANIGRIAPVRYQVPLINKVAAGYPSDFSDLDYPARIADEYVSAPEVNDMHAFAATVIGDSMLPDYREGDIVVFSPAAKVVDGNDCFVRLEPRHETTFKRVFFDEGQKIRLQPLNPKFPPTTYTREKVAGLYKAVMRIQKL